MTSITQQETNQDEAFPPNTLGAREAEGDIQQLTPTPENSTQGLDNSNEVTQMCPLRHSSPTSKYQFSERHEQQYHAHGLRM